MTTTSPLPPKWSELLDHIDQTLTQSVHFAEAREAALAEQSSLALAVPAPDNLNAHVEKLENHARHLASPLQVLDQTLQKEEEHVRAHLASIADLSRRLAEWAGRAVG